MKTIKFAAVAILMVMATSVFAQSGHGSFYVQYNSFGVGEFADVLDDMKAESEKLNGIGFGFNKAFSIASSAPLFIEIGAGLNYAWAKIYDEEDDYDHDCDVCGEEGVSEHTVKGYVEEDPDNPDGHITVYRCVECEEQMDDDYSPSAASLFGNGSLVAVISMSGVAILAGIIVFLKKKKTINKGDYEK